MQSQGQSTSKGLSLHEVPGDYTNVHPLLKKRASLRLCLDGVDVTPNFLFYISEHPKNDDRSTIVVSKASDVDICHKSTSTVPMGKETASEFDNAEPLTEEELKKLVFDTEDKPFMEPNVPLFLPPKLLYLKEKAMKELEIPEAPSPPIIIIRLQETSTFFLFDLPTVNVNEGTEEGDSAESDNEHYDYITIGKGRNRNIKTAEVQTDYSMRKDRATWAPAIEMKNKSAVANAWDLYHSYKEMDQTQNENVEFKHIQGAPPELVLLNEDDQEVERIDLSSLSRQDCNELLVKKGFKKVSDSSKHHDDF